MHRPKTSRGFTLIEAAITVAVIGILATMAYGSLANMKPRADLANTAYELQSLIHGARQKALADRLDVVVLIFPDFKSGESVGRFIVYKDGDFDMFRTSRYLDYNPALLTAGPRSEVITTYDLPKNMIFGPSNGMGGGAKLLPPYDSIVVESACSFCGGSAPNRRAAIRFDTRGQAWFYGTANPSVPIANVIGESFTLTATEIGGRATIVIGSATGAIRVIRN